MNITPKSQDTLKAQAADFISEGAPMSLDEREHLLGSLAVLTAEPVHDISFLAQKDQRYRNAEGVYVHVKKGEERTVATKDEYTHFLRDRGGSRHENISVRTEMMGAYSDFFPAVKEIKTKLAAGGNIKDDSLYVWEGVSSRAFSLNQAGKDYIVVVPRHEDTIRSTMDSRVKGAIRAKGIPHLEQVKAISYEDGVTISERVPGLSLDRLSPSEIASISQEHVDQLLTTLIEAREKGVSLDFKPGNFLYDPEVGFGVVDYQAAETTRPLENILTDMAEVFARSGNPDMQSKRIPHKFIRAKQNLFKKMQAVVSERLQGEDRQSVLSAIRANAS